jgi:hypothetical protein
VLYCSSGWLSTARSSRLLRIRLAAGLLITRCAYWVLSACATC